MTKALAYIICFAVIAGVPIFSLGGVLSIFIRDMALVWGTCLGAYFATWLFLFPVFMLFEYIADQEDKLK